MGSIAVCPLAGKGLDFPGLLVGYEWNDGRPEEKPVSDFETFQVYLWYLELLRH